MLDTFVNSINYKIKTGNIIESDEILEIMSKFEKMFNNPFISKRVSNDECKIFDKEQMLQITDAIKKLDSSIENVSLAKLLKPTEETVDDVFLSNNWLESDFVDNKKILYENLKKSNKNHKKSFIDFLFTNKVLNIYMIIVITSIFGCSIFVSLLLKWKSSGDSFENQLSNIQEIAIIKDDTDDIDEIISNSNVQNSNTSNSSKSNSNKSNSTSNKNNKKKAQCSKRFGPQYCKYIGVDMNEIDFPSLLELNSDTVGWIFINNTNVRTPLVQTDNNEFYIDHDFNKNPNPAGWVYVSFYSDFKNFSKKNTIIYGHGRADNIALGSLQDTLKESWYKKKENQIIRVATPTRDTLWEIVSLYVVQRNYYYLRYNFYDDKDYLKWIKEIVKKSKYDFGYKPSTKDRFLTITTCYDYYGKRIVMHARLVSNVKK